MPVGPSGSRITYVKPESSAEKAGLKVDDMIVEINGKPVGVTDNETDLVLRAIKESQDQTMTLKVRTLGVTRTVTATLEPIF